MTDDKLDKISIKKALADASRAHLDYQNRHVNAARVVELEAALAAMTVRAAEIEADLQVAQARYKAKADQLQAFVDAMGDVGTTIKSWRDLTLRTHAAEAEVLQLRTRVTELSDRLLGYALSAPPTESQLASLNWLSDGRDRLEQDVRALREEAALGLFPQDSALTGFTAAPLDDVGVSAYAGCHLPLALLEAEDTCPPCGHLAREHREWVRTQIARGKMA